MTVSNIVQTVTLVAGEAIPLYRFMQYQSDGKVDLADDAFVAGTSHVSTITSDGTPASAGEFLVLINGLRHEAAFDVSAATLQTALRAMLEDLHGADAVTCVGSGGGADLGDASHIITLTFVANMGLVDLVLDTGDLTGNVHVAADSTPGVDPVLAGPINGVSASESLADGDAIAMSLPLGINKVEAGAAVSDGAQVTTDSTGRVITHVSGAGGWIAGFALDAAGGAGEIIRVLTQVMQDGKT